MITLTREEAQQVLDALGADSIFTIDLDKAMLTLRARLAEPEPPQEYETEAEKRAFAFGWWKAMEAKRLAEPEPEPVAWLNDQEEMYFDKEDAKRYSNGFTRPLYTAPPQREWVGLTDEEIRNEANHHVFDESFFNGAVWARGKIKEKNNG